LTFDTVVTLIESDVNWTTITKFIRGSSCFEIGDPIGNIDATSESNYDPLEFRRVPDKAKDATIVDNDGVREGSHHAESTLPVDDILGRFVGNSGELNHSLC